MNKRNETRSITRATVGALLAACVLLFTVVLPAEYGYDPLGTGAALGLNALSGTRVDAFNSGESPWQYDVIVFELAPFEAVEYKYRLGKGEALVFSWQANAELLFDMHAEPDGATEGYAETFDKARSTRRSGSYIAPFNGIHGWFWQNRTQRDVVLELRSGGFFDGSIEMRDGQVVRYAIENNQRVIQP